MYRYENLKICTAGWAFMQSGFFSAGDIITMQKPEIIIVYVESKKEKCVLTYS